MPAASWGKSEAKVKCSQLSRVGESYLSVPIASDRKYCEILEHICYHEELARHCWMAWTKLTPGATPSPELLKLRIKYDLKAM